MPVILSATDYDRWLSPDEEPEELLRLLDAYPASEMTVRPVSTHVNNARNEDAECLSAPE
jgi:putative SOS response-associated peptidase YedK